MDVACVCAGSIFGIVLIFYVLIMKGIGRWLLVFCVICVVRVMVVWEFVLDVCGFCVFVERIECYCKVRLYVNYVFCW